MMVWKKTKT